MQSQPREQFLLISAHAPHALELTQSLTRAALENRCAVVTTRLSRHGEISALTLQVSGSWDALARLETALPALAKREGFQLNLSRSNQLQANTQAVPYMVYVSSMFRPDILVELCQFFTHHRMTLEALSYDTFLAPQTGANMLNATFTVTLPGDIQISWIRDQFLDFADALNLDAMIEPWRPQTP